MFDVLKPVGVGGSGSPRCERRRASSPQGGDKCDDVTESYDQEEPVGLGRHGEGTRGSSDEDITWHPDFILPSIFRRLNTQAFASAPLELPQSIKSTLSRFSDICRPSSWYRHSLA